MFHGITDDAMSFDFLKRSTEWTLSNGIYVFIGSPRLVRLMQSDPELQDFYFSNGGLTGKRFELLSYFTDNKIDGNAAEYQTPPGTLPPSETEGYGVLLPQGNCFSNAPDLIRDYVPRPQLEEDLYRLLLDDKHPIITLLGRGGIGKTSLALEVIRRLYNETRYAVIVWFSSRDIDLQLSGPKPVRPFVLSPDDMSKYYAMLVLPEETVTKKDFHSRSYLEQQLQKCDLGSCLFVFDNFETTQNPIEMFTWIDSFVRPPNKALITTRLRDFKGDYPLEVEGMAEPEARVLIEQTASQLDISALLNESYVEELISESAGHPYVIKILLGEVAKAGRVVNIPRIVAASDRY